MVMLIILEVFETQARVPTGPDRMSIAKTHTG
jgi:hypothetical protein